MKIYDRTDADKAEQLIKRLKKRICCLNATCNNTFSTIVAYDFSCPIIGVLSIGGFDLGGGVNADFADMAELVDALNLAYTGFATFTYDGFTITFTTVSKLEDITLVLTEDCR